MNRQQAQTLIKETFEKTFDIERFSNFIKNLLKNIDESSFSYQGQFIPDAYRHNIKKLERIGKYNDGQNKIDILVITLHNDTSLERARTMQRNFAAWYLNGSRGGELKDAALAAFVSPDKFDWRFSLVKIDYKFEQTDSGKIKVKEEFTPARRWSFLVGVNEKSHTVQSRLVGILENDEIQPTLEEIEKAFDIETVTKEFFIEYRNLFLRTKEELDGVVKGDSKIKKDFETNVVDTVNFAKKLLGQIVFLYFLQKKGWFGAGRNNEWGTGSKHFLREIFDKKHGNYKNFFNDILEPLFYEALRIDRSHDDDYYSRFNCKIPFLNGGLFDPIGNYDWVHTDIHLPDELFSNKNKTKNGYTGNGILDIFDRYNFTVKEDEPLEKEVAIDPELLGKAYEKFNAIRPDNFDEFKKAVKTGKPGEENKFNKKFGVYYTPREIVHYMCQQSLICYLENELDGKVSREDIETLVHLGETVSQNEARVVSKGRETEKYSYQLPQSIRDSAKPIDDKLADITVCDPAVGSGAFPVGMMTEIVRVRNVLNILKNDKSLSSYNLKRQCIEKSLYGVDIDAGAVEIAKLRLWLSLVVDEDDIKGIKPLPNLDYKIVCGNSLIGVEKNLTNERFFSELEKLKPVFFCETNPTKKQTYKNQIDELINQITSGHNDFDFEIYFSEVFHKKGGFDLVIANPPFVGEKGNKDIFQPIAKGNLAKFYQGKMDLFYFFFHLALNLSKNKGHIAFITTNYYPTASGAKKLRQDFKERVIIKNVINFNELKIFESALGQHNMISILEKGYNGLSNAKTCITQNQGFATPEILGQILNGLDTMTNYYNISQKDLYDGVECYIRIMKSNNNSDNFITIILDKIKNIGPTLNVNFNINQGVVSGADKVSRRHLDEYNIRENIGTGIFILTNEEVNNLKLDIQDKLILKPWFKNSDVFRWGTFLSSNEKVIYADKRLLNLENNKLKDYLMKFKMILDKSSDNSPYLHRPRDIDFDSAKIVVPQRSKTNTFGYNEVPWYASADVYFITEKDKSIHLKYVLGLLNSKLYYLWLYHRGKRKGETLELYQKPLSEIPIKKVSKEEQKPFIEVVNKILKITTSEDYQGNVSKKVEVEKIKGQIDQMVCKLYGLTKEEIDIVESSGK